MKPRAYVTLNYDTLLYEALDDAGRPPNLHADKTPLIKYIEKQNLIHLHGCILKIREHGIILTRNDYIEAYGENSAIRRFFRCLLEEHNVLFVGCDLKDPDFEELFIDASQFPKKWDTRTKLFILRHQLPPIEVKPGEYEADTIGEAEENEYYEELNITVVRYNPKKNFIGLDQALANLRDAGAAITTTQDGSWNSGEMR